MRYEKKFPSPGSWASLEAQVVKNPPAIQKTWVRSLSWEDPMEEGMAAHSSTLAWSGQRSLAGYSSWSRRVGHNRATNHTSGSPCHLSISHTSVGHIYHQAGQNTFRDSPNLTWHTQERDEGNLDKFFRVTEKTHWLQTSLIWKKCKKCHKKVFRDVWY